MCQSHLTDLTQKQYGFTLLELMLAMSLGSVLVLLLLVFYSQGLKFYYQVNQLAEELENGRYACFFLRRLLKQSVGVKGLTDLEKNNHLLRIKKTSDAFEQITLEHDQQIKTTLFISEITSKPPGKKLYGLFKKQAGKPRIEIAEGIQDMKVWYGVKAPSMSHVDRYIPANEVVDWHEVVIMKIILLSQTGSNPKVKEWRMYIAVNQGTS